MSSAPYHSNGGGPEGELRLNPGLAVLFVVICVAAGGILFATVDRQRNAEITRHAPAETPRPAPQATPPEAGHDISKYNGVVGPASVVDGDTIKIQGTRIRLNGIDAPELAQTCNANNVTYQCGQKAAMALTELLSARIVNCTPTGTDRWQRVVAKCFVEGRDIGEWMVKEGWAIAYRKYSLDYVSAEETARAAKRGLFAGTFAPPEEWRIAKQNGDAHVRQ